MNNSNRVSGRTWGWLLLALLLPGLASAKPFSGIVVFGDSLSDPGNSFILSKSVGESAYLSVPPYTTYVDPLALYSIAPYARGGHHYSNGATWVEQLARSLAVGISTRPAFQGASAAQTNYAVAGSTALSDYSDFGMTPSVPLNLTEQVFTFLGDAGGMAPADALYVIEFGGNDVRAALMLGDLVSGTAFIQHSVANIEDKIRTLYAAGARQFLVTSSPDLGLTPAVRLLAAASGSPELVGAATYFSLLYNQMVELKLQELEAGALPGATFHRLSFFEILHQLHDAPDAYGLTNVEDACILPSTAPYTCQEPNHYLFWDGLHPTTNVHGIVADVARSVVAP